jgi:hypothetical protein
VGGGRGQEAGRVARLRISKITSSINVLWFTEGVFSSIHPTTEKRSSRQLSLRQTGFWETKKAIREQKGRGVGNPGGK